MSDTKVAIIGSGPTGYTAGIYAGRARLEPVLFAGEKSGGQLMLTTDIENFPGFPDGKSGPLLMSDMRKQAEKFGAKIVDKYVTAVDFSQKPFKLWTNVPEGMTTEALENGSPEELAAFTAAVKQSPPALTADAVVIAVGATSKMVGIPGEKELMGRGVSVCAVCDAAFYKNKTAVVIGGGDAAMEDTLALTKFVSSVQVLVRGDQMRASKIMQERVLNHPKVKVRFNTLPVKVNGSVGVESITVQDAKTKQESTEPVDGVFVAIGHTPMTKIFVNELALDEKGFILTRQSLGKQGLEMAQAALDEHGRIAYPTTTSVEGVFAAGDVVDTRYWQAITAASQGCMAAIDAERWLEGR